MITLPRLRW